MSGHAKTPPASHQVSATSLKLLIQQIHPHVRVERDSGMCVARGLYELWCRSPYTRMFVARTSQVNDRGAHADAEAPRIYLIVVNRPYPAVPLVVRCMYMAVVPGPMPAAEASRCCRRRLQQLVCACGS